MQLHAGCMGMQHKHCIAHCARSRRFQAGNGLDARSAQSGISMRLPSLACAATPRPEKSGMARSGRARAAQALRLGLGSSAAARWSESFRLRPRLSPAMLALRRHRGQVLGHPLG